MEEDVVGEWDEEEPQGQYIHTETTYVMYTIMTSS